MPRWFLFSSHFPEWPAVLPQSSQTTTHTTRRISLLCEHSLLRGKRRGPAGCAGAWRPTLTQGGSHRRSALQSWEVTGERSGILRATGPRALEPHPEEEDGGGAGPGGGACLGAGRGRPEKTEAQSPGVAVEPGSRNSTFLGAGLLETAGGKTRRPEASAFFDARARDAAAVGRAPGEERPQTEPSQPRRPPLLPVSEPRSSSPPSSWPWSVRTSAQASASLQTQPSSPTALRRPGVAAVSAAPGRPYRAPEAPVSPGLPSRDCGRPARGPRVG